MGLSKRLVFERLSIFLSTESNMIKRRLARAVAGLALGIPALFAVAAMAETLTGDADRGAEQFEATCAECHGAAATAPTLRGIIDRPVASVADFYGYSMALQAKKDQKWTVENLDAYMKSPTTFAPGNLMYREYKDPQMRADIIAFLATLPPPR
jgi:cytochrome c